MCQPLLVHKLPELALTAEVGQQALAAGDKIFEGEEFPHIGIVHVAQYRGISQIFRDASPVARISRISPTVWRSFHMKYGMISS
ncbi:MAG: hypothetical protein ONB49_10695, partial [candidate division KSB1 bacterium]|nr:hypothetical protein [candidate division KSB1 bacterium]